MGSKGIALANSRKGSIVVEWGMGGGGNLVVRDIVIVNSQLCSNSQSAFIVLMKSE
jgi:hypothetical protein